LEEHVAPRGVVAKLGAQDAEGAGRVAEPERHRLGRLPLDKKGTEGFVLPVQGLTGLEEESGLGGGRYPISSTVAHKHIMPHNGCPVKRVFATWQWFTKCLIL